MSQQDILNLAKEGDARAIAFLIGQALQSFGVTAKASLENDSLHLLLEAAQLPAEEACLRVAIKGLQRLQPNNIYSVTIYGRRDGQQLPAWTQTVELKKRLTSAPVSAPVAVSVGVATSAPTSPIPTALPKVEKTQNSTTAPTQTPEEFPPKPRKISTSKPTNSRFTHPNAQTNLPEMGEQEVPFEGQKPEPALSYPLDFQKGYNLDTSDESLPLIRELGGAESGDGVVEGDQINSDTVPLEIQNNGYSDTDFNIPETTNRADSLSSSRKQKISLPKTADRPKLDIIEALIEDLQHLNPAKRRKAIWELGQQGDSRAVEPLLYLLANSDSKQYSLILASLSEIGIRTLKPMNNAWSISLQNENPEVRKNAIRDLTRVYELVNQISHLLHRAADDPDAEVKETARWAINQLNRINPRSGRDD